MQLLLGSLDLLWYSIPYSVLPCFLATSLGTIGVPSTLKLVLVRRTILRMTVVSAETCFFITAVVTITEGIFREWLPINGPEANEDALFASTALHRLLSILLIPSSLVFLDMATNQTAMRMPAKQYNQLPTVDKATCSNDCIYTCAAHTRLLR